MSAKGARRLPREEARERRLLRACGRGDRRAQAGLVEAYLPVVRTIAAGYTGNGLAFDDLCQEGAIGLLDAMAHYDPSRDRSFEPYARFRIRRAIKSGLTDQARLIRLPKHVVEHRRTISRAEVRLLAKGDVTTPETVAGETGLPVASVRAARAAPLTLLSLDASGTVEGPSVASTLADPNAGDPADEVVLGERVDLLERTIARLPNQQRQVVARRFGLGAQPPVSARALAADLKLSPRRTQAIARDALDTLRRELEPTATG